jgi:hypothetical protein
MAEDGKQRDAVPKWRIAGWWSMGGLAFIGLSGLIVLFIAWSGHPANNTLRYEVAKTCMQVLAVVFFGALATIATFTFQRSRAQEDSHLEQDRLRHDNALQQRRSEDDQLRSIMDDTLASYNRIKRIRRLLRAETRDGDTRHITLTIYDKHMGGLIDEQLEFERLKRFTPFINDERLNPHRAETAGEVTAGEVVIKEGEEASQETYGSSALTKAYREIEEYLNGVIGEYEKQRHIVINDLRASLSTPNEPSEFGKLSGFIGKEFLKVSNEIDKIVNTLLSALSQRLPGTEEGND